MVYEVYNFIPQNILLEQALVELKTVSQCDKQFFRFLTI